MPLQSRFSVASSYFLSVLRIVAAFLFMCHGLQKMFGLLGGHRVPLAGLPGIAGVLEVVGGALLLVGLFTRLVAFIVSGEMAFAYFLVHAKNGFLPIQNHGELPVLLCFVFLYLAFAGGGIASVDALIRKRE